MQLLIVQRSDLQVMVYFATDGAFKLHQSATIRRLPRDTVLEDVTVSEHVAIVCCQSPFLIFERNRSIRLVKLGA